MPMRCARLPARRRTARKRGAFWPWPRSTMEQPAPRRPDLGRLSGRSGRRTSGCVLVEEVHEALQAEHIAGQDHLRDVPDRGALVHKSATQGDLLRRQLRRAPEAHAPRPGGNPPRTCSLVDEGPLELRHAGEDRQHHLAGRRGCIGPRLPKAAQAGAALLQELRDLQQIAR